MMKDGPVNPKAYEIRLGMLKVAFLKFKIVMIIVIMIMLSFYKSN